MPALKSILKVVKDHTMFKIINSGGQGPVPSYLQGVFTNETVAKERIVMFNAIKKEKLESKPRVKAVKKEAKD